MVMPTYVWESGDDVDDDDIDIEVKTDTLDAIGFVQLTMFVFGIILSLPKVIIYCYLTDRRSQPNIYLGDG